MAGVAHTSILQCKSFQEFERDVVSETEAEEGVVSRQVVTCVCDDLIGVRHTNRGLAVRQ